MTTTPPKTTTTTAAQNFFDDETTTTTTTKVTTTTTTPSTPVPEQCFVCDQADANQNGACWDVKNNADQELQVCEKGCYSKFTQDREVFEAEDKNLQTNILRKCADSAPGKIVESHDINYCTEPLCNNEAFSVGSSKKDFNF